MHAYLLYELNLNFTLVKGFNFCVLSFSNESLLLVYDFSVSAVLFVQLVVEIMIDTHNQHSGFV